MADQLRIIGDNNDPKKLTKIQKQFNNLTKKIEKQRETLKILQDTFPKANQRIQKELYPINEKYLKLRMEMVHLFDQHYQNSALKKPEKKKLSLLIQNHCSQIFESTNDADLVEVYNRYAEVSYEEEIQLQIEEEKEMTKDFFETMFGVEIDLDKLDEDPEVFQSYLEEQLRAQEEAEEAREQKRKEAKAKKPKTEKQLEREAKIEAAQKNMSKSVKEVYAALVKAFHPDREMDETEKLRKTAIMQEVTAAYEKNDLLTLLQLQLQFEQIDEAHLSQIAEEQLKYYIRVLEKQSQQIRQELFEAENDLRSLLTVPMYITITPQVVDGHINKDIKSIKKGIKDISEELKLLQSVSYLKALLSHLDIDLM